MLAARLETMRKERDQRAKTMKQTPVGAAVGGPAPSNEFVASGTGPSPASPVPPSRPGNPNRPKNKRKKRKGRK